MSSSSALDIWGGTGLLAMILEEADINYVNGLGSRGSTLPWYPTEKIGCYRCGALVGT